MQKLFCSALAIGLLAIALLPASADDGSWMPNLNPFSGNGQTPTSSRAAAPPTSGWKMPKLMPTGQPSPLKTQAKRRPAQQTTWNKMSSGTQNLFSKTADVLNPWDKKQPAPPPKLTGSNSIFTNKSTTKAAAKDTAVQPASWWSTDKGNQRDKSVNDFLSRPRPQ